MKRIIDGHLGEVSAHGHEGPGATFVVKLPVVSSTRDRLLTPPGARPSAPRR